MGKLWQFKLRLMIFHFPQLASQIQEEHEAREEMERYSNACGKEKGLIAAELVLICCVFIAAITLDSL